MFKEAKMNNILLHNLSQVKSHEITETRIHQLMETFHTDEFLRKSEIEKTKGISPSRMLYDLLLMTIQNNRSISEGMRDLKTQKHKSTIYEFLSNPNLDWRKFLLMLAKYYSNQYKADEKKDSYLIIDDTPKKKSGTRGEYLSRFRDHASHSNFTGYETLFSAWSNGRTCIPVDFELKIGNKRSKNSKNGRYKRGTHINKRIKLAKMKKTDLSILMIKRARRHKLLFNYVLWDSWFNNSKAFKYVYENLVPKNIHLVSMVKQSKDKYQLNNVEMRANELFELAGVWKIIKSNKVKYKSIVIDIIDKTSKSKKNRPVIGKAKLCFFHFPKQKKNEYKIILSTNIELTEEDILEKYSQRWSIEVMIKDLKQHLGFNQSMSSKYSSMVNNISIRCAFYIMLCSMKDRAYRKSIYIVMFEVSNDIQNYCLEYFILYMFKRLTRDLLEFSLQQGIKYIKELLEQFDKAVETFLRSKGLTDKIVEIYNDKYTPSVLTYEISICQITTAEKISAI